MDVIVPDEIKNLDFRYLIFDLDGTLVDSLNETSVILNQMREQRRLPPLPENSYRKLVSYGASALLDKAVGQCNEAMEDLILEFRSRYGKYKTSIGSVYLGVFEMLDELKQLGIRFAICSNKPNYLCNAVLKDTGLIRFFGDAVVAGGDAVQLKPHREPLDKAMALIGADPDRTALVGDSTVDQRTAKEANVSFLFYSGGYNDGVNEQQAALSFYDFSELLKKMTV